MKTSILIFSLSFCFAFSFIPPSHVGKCGVNPIQSYTQNIFGQAIGYYVVFKNGSQKKVDGIKWKAYFYDNFNDYQGTRDGSWQSGNFISPIKVGETASDLENVWVDGANKVNITITKVHFTDGTSCGK